MSRLLKEQQLRNELLTGLINESAFQEEMDKVMQEDQLKQLEVSAEDNLEKALKAVVNQLPAELQKTAQQKGDKDNELDINEESAFEAFAKEGNYGDKPEQIAEAIKDWAGNYMLGMNEPDYKGVSDSMTPEIYKLVKESAPKTYISELKTAILSESKKKKTLNEGEIKYELAFKDDAINDAVGSDEVEEGIGALAASVALSAPAIVQAAGKASSWLGKKTDAKFLNKIGHALEHFGHEWHHTYEKLIAKMIKKLAPNAPDDKVKKASKAVLLSIIGTMAVVSGMGAADYLSKGKAAVGGLEAGLSGVKSTELLSALSKVNPMNVAKSIGKVLPKIMDQYFETSPNLAQGLQNAEVSV